MKKNFLFTLIFLFLSLISVDANDRVIKILAIGNSFSEDATETFLNKLAEGGQVKILIGDAVIGGCPLERHWNNAVFDIPGYSYRKIDPEGKKVVESQKTLAEIIEDEAWDYISFQQASPISGVYSTYIPYLQNLLGYAKEHAKNPQVQFAFHITWAYEGTSTHGGFVKYGKDQTTMFDAIVDAAQRAALKSGINILLPSGPAIQYARETELGDHFCRDGYHLNNLGKYTAASVWYEVLTGNPVMENPFLLPEISENESRVLQQSAHKAILHTRRLQACLKQ
jgi:hypothetical protein